MSRYDAAVPESEIEKLIDLVDSGARAKDIIEAGIKNTKGSVVSERQARRYIRFAKDVQGWQSENEDDKSEISNEDSAFTTPYFPEVKNLSAVVDLEVLSPSFNSMGKYSHYLLCASFLPFDGSTKTLSISFEDNRDDKRLLRAVLDELSKYTFIVGHNVKGFDLNWLVTRCMFYGWDVPNLRLFYYDTYSAARRIPISHRKGLGSLIDFFRFTDEEKTQIMPVMWDRVRSPYQKDFDEAMSNIIRHCESDVSSNKRVYDVLMKYDPAPKWKAWPR